MQTFTLDLVTGADEDKILADQDTLTKVVTFFKNNKDILMLILNVVNEEDATYLIAKATGDIDTAFHRGMMKGRENLYAKLEKYEIEQDKRDAQQKEKVTETLESPPAEVVEGSV